MISKEVLDEIIAHEKEFKALQTEIEEAHKILTTLGINRDQEITWDRDFSDWKPHDLLTRLRALHKIGELEGSAVLSIKQPSDYDGDRQVKYAGKKHKSPH